MLAYSAVVAVFINLSVFTSNDRDVNTFQRAGLVGFVRICASFLMFLLLNFVMDFICIFEIIMHPAAACYVMLSF